MNVHILATGSSGNSVVIADRILIDAGLTIKTFTDFGYDDLDAMIITHPHGDHMKTPLVRRLLNNGMKAYLPNTVIAKLTEENMIDINQLIVDGQVEVLNTDTVIQIDELTITPYPQKHHDIVNYAIVVESDEHRLLYATDLDTLEPTDIGVGLLSLGMFDTILLEGNYCEIYLREYIEYMVSLVPSESSPELLTDDELDKWVRMNYRFLPEDVSRNAFRAIQNHRHMSKQQARAYALTHLNPGGKYYEIHRSSMFYQAPDDWYFETED